MSCHATKHTTVIAIRQDEYSFPSPSEGKKKKRDSHFKCYNKNKKTAVTVVYTITQPRAPENSSLGEYQFSPPLFYERSPSRRMPCFHIQGRFTLLQQFQNDKGSITYKRNWSRRRGRSKSYQNPINPSYRSSTKPKVAQGINSSGTVNKTGFSSSRPAQKK